MRKKISNSLTLFFSSNYPKTFSKSSKKNFIVIGIGGNIGDVQKRFNKLFLDLKNNKRFDVIKTSPLLKNPPFGYLNQDDFLNGIVLLRSNLAPKECLKIFQRYENRYKRIRDIKDGPRTLDIDIIFFNNQKIKNKKLIVPHPSWHKRDSVKIPLSYI